MSYEQVAKGIIESINEEKSNQEELSVSEEKIVAPIKGRAMKLEEVPDQIFAQKIMGDGIAIEPSDFKVLAPFNGRVIHLLDKKHAIGLATESGLEVLIHVGIDTVKMDGEGFESFVEEGDNVVAGDKLLEFDLELVEEKAESIITPLVITNTDDCIEVNILNEGEVESGEKLLEVKL